MAFPICHFPASRDTGSKIGGCGFYTLSGQTKFPNKIPTKFPSKFHCLFLGGSNAEDKLLVIQDVTISGMLTFQHFCSKQIETKLEQKKKNPLFHLHLFVERLYHPYMFYKGSLPCSVCPFIRTQTASYVWQKVN